MRKRGAEKSRPGTNSGEYSKQSRKAYYRYMATHPILNSWEYFGSWAKIAMALTTELRATRKL
jgi:hypothetical protein